MTTAAMLALLGLPAHRFLTTTDEEERLLLAAVARRAVALHDQMQQNQAVLIANALVKAKVLG